MVAAAPVLAAGVHRRPPAAACLPPTARISQDLPINCLLHTSALTTLATDRMGKAKADVSQQVRRRGIEASRRNQCGTASDAPAVRLISRH